MIAGALPGSFPTDGVLIDAPMVFNAGLGVPSSYCVIDNSTGQAMLPASDWGGHYSFIPGPAGSGSGTITITNGEASIGINANNLPSNGAFACDPMTHGNHGCIIQTVTCSGTAFVPTFVK